MATVAMQEGVWGNVRIAISAAWEATASLMLVAHHGSAAPWPYGDWADTARARGGPANDEWIVEATRCGLPNFLTPPPAASPRPLADELADLVDQPAEAVREELRRRPPLDTPPALRRFAADPKGSLNRFADALLAHWTVAVEPIWPLVRYSLDQEILTRGRTIATEGPKALLATLPDKLRWRPPELHIPIRGDSRRLVCGDQLTLVPLLFGRGLTVVTGYDSHSVAVSYQARGAAALARAPQRLSLARPEDPFRTDPLAMLVGRGRAAVVRALVVPTTTTTLANTLGLAASTVSEHLSTLLAAGIVKRRRAGMNVLYELDHSGVTLLGIG